MNEEELAHANYNLIESLKFFEDGTESRMFKIKKKKTENQESQQDLIVTLRKHNMKQNGQEVVMVIVRDVTDQFNHKEV